MKTHKELATEAIGFPPLQGKEGLPVSRKQGPSTADIARTANAVGLGWTGGELVLASWHLNTNDPKKFPYEDLPENVKTLVDVWLQDS